MFLCVYVQIMSASGSLYCFVFFFGISFGLSWGSVPTSTVPHHSRLVDLISHQSFCFSRFVVNNLHLSISGGVLVAPELGIRIDILKLLTQVCICWQLRYGISSHSSSSAIILGWDYSRNLYLLKSAWINVYHFYLHIRAEPLYA